MFTNKDGLSSWFATSLRRVEMMSRPTSLREMTLTGQVKREIHYRGTNNKVIEALKSKIPKKFCLRCSNNNGHEKIGSLFPNY